MNLNKDLARKGKGFGSSRRKSEGFGHLTAAAAKEKGEVKDLAAVAREEEKEVFGSDCNCA